MKIENTSRRWNNHGLLVIAPFPTVNEFLAIRKFTIVCFEDDPVFIAVILLVFNPLSLLLA